MMGFSVGLAGLEWRRRECRACCPRFFLHPAYQRFWRFQDRRPVRLSLFAIAYAPRECVWRFVFSWRAHGATRGAGGASCPSPRTTPGRSASQGRARATIPSANASDAFVFWRFGRGSVSTEAPNRGNDIIDRRERAIHWGKMPSTVQTEPPIESTRSSIDAIRSLIEATRSSIEPTEPPIESMEPSIESMKPSIARTVRSIVSIEGLVVSIEGLVVSITDLIASIEGSVVPIGGSI